MRLGNLGAAVLAAALPLAPAIGQAVMQVPYAGSNPAPVSQAPSDPRDTPEEIAKDAARDLKDSRFYNKPGATRAQYDADWQQCRLIARGSRTPSGSVPVYYNPAVISPLAAGIGGGLGGLIGAAIQEGQQRRDNRRSCLLIRGWRLVEVPAAEQARVNAMTDAQRGAYFNEIVGAQSVNGTVTARTSFTPPKDPALLLDAPLAGPGSVFLGKKVDTARPLRLGANEAAVVIAYRRPGGGSTGRSAQVRLARYDAAAGDLAYRPRDWKKKGDRTVYDVVAASVDRKSPYEVQVFKVTPGDYVIAGTAIGPGVQITNSHCFGAPAFTVGAGEVAYLGDFLPFMGQKLSDGSKPLTLMAYASHPDDARATLASKQPAIAAALQPARLRNGATYACSAMTMDRWDLPGATAPAQAGTVAAR